VPRSRRLVHPGPVGNANTAGARRETNVTRLLMGARMAGAAVARQFRYSGTDAAERECQNENSARCPDDRIGSRRSRLALGRNGSCMLGDVQWLPMSFHRPDPLIGNFDSRACRVSKRKPTPSSVSGWGIPANPCGIFARRASYCPLCAHNRARIVSAATVRFRGNPELTTSVLAGWWRPANTWPGRPVTVSLWMTKTLRTAGPGPWIPAVTGAPPATSFRRSHVCH
jgi:hypothetical protein